MSKRGLFKTGLVTGLGWAVGVTVGFVIISTLLVFILRSLGGLPFIGDSISKLVEPTLETISKRTPIAPNE